MKDIRDTGKEVEDAIEQTETRLIDYKNSIVNGHIIIGLATLVHMLGFFVMHQPRAVAGVVLCVAAYTVAWMMSGLQREQRVTAEKLCFGFALAAWIWAAIWAIHAARAF